jgi:glyoxylase-like metal-dependent hydrolase (beta-lactamase superfamily II)
MVHADVRPRAGACCSFDGETLSVEWALGNRARGRSTVLDVEGSWFRLTGSGDGVTLIREVAAEPLAACNIWHVRGRDRDLLIDTGSGLRSLRREVALLAGRPVVCVATHSHFDHIGGFWEFADRRGHAAEAPIFAAPDRRNTQVEGWLTAQSFAVPFDPESYTLRPAPLTATIDEGDVIDLGDRILRVLHLPGHSPGSIGLWEAATGCLFSGDAAYDGPMFDDLPDGDPALFRASLGRLRDLPIRVVHGGHFASFDGGRLREIAERWLRAHL